MRQFYLVSIAALVLASCSNNYKVRNIISFTNELHAENTAASIVVPHKQNINSWQLDASYINIDATDLPDKIKFEKLKISSDIAASPLILEDKIIVLSGNGTVTAFEKSDLSKIWSISLISKTSSMKAFKGSVTYHDGRLYITTGTQMLDILNPANGRRFLSKKFPDVIIAPPLVHGNLILLLSLGNQLYAINKDTNAMVWDHAGNPETLTYGNMSSVSIDNQGRIFVSYSSGQIYLLNINGQVIWQYDLSAGQTLPGLLPTNVTAKPILENDHIYLADSNGQFYKFDTTKGHVIWKKNIQDVQTINSLGNAIFITTNARQAAAINKEDGKIIWVTDILDDIYTKGPVKLVPDPQGKKIESTPLPKNAGFFSRFTNSFQPKKNLMPTKEIYDKSKLKPINFLRSIFMNDLYTLYTSQGNIYYLSPKNGQILSQKKLDMRLNFVTVADSVILASGKKIFISK